MLFRGAVLVFALPVAAVSLAGGVGALAFSSAGAHAVGYCLSCLLPFLLVAGQRRASIRLQAEKGIVRAGYERWLAVALLGLGLLVASVHAWYFAWSVS